VRRTVVRRRSAPLAQIALQELLAGTDVRGRRQGLRSAIPAETRLRSFSIAQGTHGSTATVDLAGLPPLSDVSGVTIARIGTQIARTLIGVSDVARVRIESSGRPWNFSMMGGGVSRRAWDYQLLLGLWVANFKALP
jgi:spore germination protein GerM